MDLQFSKLPKFTVVEPSRSIVLPVYEINDCNNNLLYQFRFYLGDYYGCYPKGVSSSDKYDRVQFELWKFEDNVYCSVDYDDIIDLGILSVLSKKEQKNNIDNVSGEIIFRDISIDKICDIISLIEKKFCINKESKVDYFQCRACGKQCYLAGADFILDDKLTCYQCWTSHRRFHNVPDEKRKKFIDYYLKIYS